MTRGNITLDFENVDYLDASSLQVLLAVGAEQKSLGRQLHLANTSAAMLHWFEWTGAAQHLSMTEKRSGNA